MKKMKKYEYLLFDADNTLYDFSLAEKNAFRETCLIKNLPYDETIYRNYSEINDGLWKKLERKEVNLEFLKVERFRLLLISLGRIENDEMLADAADMSILYMENLGKQTCLVDGAKEICPVLSKKYKMYIITNGISRIQRARFDNSEIRGYFEELFISEEIGYSKPSPAYFDHVLEKIGDADRSKYLVIGDSLTSDCDGAIASGIDICRFNPKSEDDNGRKLTYTVKRLAELCDIL